MTTQNLKLRAPVPFPANVVGSGGIGVTKANGTFTISPDFANIDPLITSAISDPTTKQIWIYDPVSGTANGMTLAGLGDALYKMTSMTSFAVGTGSKAFATQSGKDLTVGDFVLISSNAAPTTNYMGGQVTAYSGTLLTVNVTSAIGSGTHTDWTIRMAGQVGPTGATGPSGSLGASGTPTVNQFATWLNATTAQGVSITGIVKGNGASAPAAATAGTDYVAPGTTSNLTAGFTTTSVNVGTKSTGTFTPDPTLGNIQHYTNGGAHTLAPPASVCTLIIECTNATAGALTTSGFSLVDGDTYSSTGTKKHIFYITKTNSFSRLTVIYVTGT